MAIKYHQNTHAYLLNNNFLETTKSYSLSNQRFYTYYVQGQFFPTATRKVSEDFNKDIDRIDQNSIEIKDHMSCFGHHF